MRDDEEHAKITKVVFYDFEVEPKLQALEGESSDH